MQVSSGARGFLISLEFNNTDPRSSIEIWFPIDGYLDLQKNEKGYIRNEYVCRILETNPDVASNIKNIELDDYLLAPNQMKSSTFLCIVEPHIAHRLYNYINNINMNYITFNLRLLFSALFNAGTLSQKTKKVMSSIPFSINKDTLRSLIDQWYTFYMEAENLSGNIPSDIADNYLEAVRCFNANAYRASVVMARRTLELALFRKGLMKEKKSIWDFIQGEKEKSSEQRVLSGKVLDLLNAIRVFGNYGAHVSDDMLNDITEEDARLTIEILKKAISELFSK
ncbi:hypothetical protein B6F84_08990 [Acidianus manzaensis]|uniref:DUF4145 domain-containing protein n=2 Tax=Acidianus manzaensis TaxID=282676 RepID=A0A1W6K0Y9_9CREN|nr:hypothetical protein B6F84_08990 [Acidianus manzaensis]